MYFVQENDQGIHSPRPYPHEQKKSTTIDIAMQNPDQPLFNPEQEPM